MKWLLAILFSLSGISACKETHQQIKAHADYAFTAGETIDFTFESRGIEISGILDIPNTPDTKALILFVHGYGPTDVRARNTFWDLRSRFNQLGIATAVWDKPGQGRSQGKFDINQPVHESAQELIDAAAFMRKIKAPGAFNIGVWGVSRGGWIVPIALSKDPNLQFWISVSGTKAEDNFTYLLLSNLPYEGGSAEQAEQLANEWRSGCRLLRTGGSFEDYKAATTSLHNNAYITNQKGGWFNRLSYYSQQKNCQSGVCPKTDTEFCDYVWIDNFDEMLASLDIDVLAIFGEKDLNVNWAKTRDLYRDTIGQNPNASLVIHSFKDADHNLHISQTGSLKEMGSKQQKRKSDGYYKVQVEWLEDYILGKADAM